MDPDRDAPDTPDSPASMMRLRRDALGLVQAPTPLQRLDALISRDDAEEAVQALDPYTLYHLVRALGEHDALALLDLASTEQVQAFVDFDAWRGDLPRPERLTRWFELLLTLEDDLRFEQHVRDLDPELPALLFKHHLQVFMLDEELQPPPELEALGIDYDHSPDNVYAIVYPDDERVGRMMRALLDRIYGFDPTLARIFLEAARWELTAPMEELAYQMRRGRLEALGFVDPYEALAIYAWRNPEQTKQGLWRRAQDDAQAPPAPLPRPPADFSLPEVFRDHVRADGFFHRALMRLVERTADDPRAGDPAHDPAAKLMWAAVLLTNKAMAADHVEPGNLDATRRTFARVQGTLSLALHFLADRDLDRAVYALQHLHLEHIFQVGFGLTLTLQRQAQRLVHSDALPPQLTLIDDQPYALLDPRDRVVLRGLLKRRPEFGHPDDDLTTPFDDLAQFEATAARLSLIAFKLMAAFGALGLSQERLASVAYRDDVLPPVADITLDLLLRTAVLNAALRHPDPLRPLTPALLADLIRGPVHAAAAALAPHPAPATGLRPAHLLAALDDTPLMAAALNRLTPADAPADGLPIARLVARRLVERLADDLAPLSPDALLSGDLPPHLLGDTALLHAPDLP